jgi:hypothetical protein
LYLLLRVHREILIQEENVIHGITVTGITEAVADVTIETDSRFGKFF